MGLIKFLLKSMFVLIILGIIIIGGLFIYFYYFHVFKEVRICVPEQALDTNITCSTNQYCLDMMKSNVPEFQNLVSQTNNSPAFVQSAITKALPSIIFCGTTCRIRQMNENSITGLNQPAASCSSGYLEAAKIDIHGKELIQLLIYMKNNANLFK